MNKITFNGETHSVSAWAKKIGVHKKTLHWRLSKWGDVEKALTYQKHSQPERKHHGSTIAKMDKDMARWTKGLNDWINKVNWPVPGR